MRHYEPRARSRSQALPVFLVATALALLPSPVSAQEKSREFERAVEKISRLSLESRRQEEGCRSYFERMKKVTPDSQKREFFASKTSALAALELARKYPGTPLATSDALVELMMLSELPKGAVPAELQESLARLSDCHSVEYFGVLTRLMDSRTRRHFSAAELASLRTWILTYLEREASTGPKFFHQTDKMVDLFRVGLDQGLFSAIPENQNVIANLSWRISKVRGETGEATLEELVSRLNHGEEIQDELRQLVEAELDGGQPPGSHPDLVDLAGLALVGPL